jgi:N utilization substance protein B
MSLRHKSREYALQMLFQWEIGKQQPERIQRGFWQIARAEKATRLFADHLFEGTTAGATELDSWIAGHAENWRLERFAVIDRAILRMAAFELRSSKTPPKVILNEAIDLAKKFSSEDAAPFINGVLDSLLKSIGKPSAEKKEES